MSPTFSYCASTAQVPYEGVLCHQWVTTTFPCFNGIFRNRAALVHSTASGRQQVLRAFYKRLYVVGEVTASSRPLPCAQAATVGLA